MPRLEQSTEAGVTAPCSGFGVLGMDGHDLRSASDAPTAASQQPGRELRHSTAVPGRCAVGE